MNTNLELLQFYVYKRLISRKETDKILEECRRLKMSVREYLLAKEMITETAELEALGEYFCLPSVEIDMLEIDKSLFDLFTYDFMKKHKIIKAVAMGILSGTLELLQSPLKLKVEKDK